MDVGKINDSSINNSISETKNKVTDDSFKKRLESALGQKDEKELKKACQDFEGMLLNMMYKEMKATIPKSDLLPEDTGKDIFDSMLDDKLMDEASKSNGIGLADTLYKQLSKQLKSTYKVADDTKTDSVEDK